MSRVMAHALRRHWLRRVGVALCAATGLGMLAACSDSATVSTPTEAARDTVQQPAGGAMQSAEVYQQIRLLVGDAKASNASFCRKVPLGHRPCGGPESYLVYSAEGIDEPKLLALVAQYGSLRQAEHQASGMMSTCEVIPEPGIDWADGVCKAGAAGDAF